MTEKLTQQDVVRLLSDPSVQTRADMAAKVARQFADEGLSDAERSLAEDIVRAMARDAVERVRQSLSENIKATPNLPHDVALTLARDVEAVAVPLISVSTVLSDADLIEIVGSGSSAKQTAVAVRPTVSTQVSEVLAERGDERAVAALVANKGAAIGEESLNRVVDRFGDNAAVQAPLVHRDGLPITVAERLVAKVSENLQEYLVTHHALPEGMASDIILRSRERATVSLFATERSDDDLVKLVTQLHVGGRLTPSLIVRALCMGDLSFFECAMAFLAKVPLPNARAVIHEGGAHGLRSIFEKARLPRSILPAVQVGLLVAAETGFDGEAHDRERHRRRTIERILTQYEEMESADADYLLDKLSDLVHGPSASQASQPAA